MSKAIRSPITPPGRPSVTNVTGRRTAFGLFGAVMLATLPTPAAASPDAELLALCDEFNEMERQIEVAYSDGPGGINDDNKRDEVLEPVRARQDAILDRMVTIRATTIEGVRARGVLFATWGDDILQDWAKSCGYDDRMLFALVRDAAALSGPAGATWPASAEREGA